MAAREEPAMASMASIGNPPEGVVQPPSGIRNVIERTAGFVVRNGPAFEDTLRKKNADQPKFSFLFKDDAYRAYYEWRLKEIREGRGTDVSAGREGQAGAAPAQDKPKGPPRPQEFQFSARMPVISNLDLDVIQATARHVAKNGRGFMAALSQQQARNYQFDFLRPQHSFHQFFMHLVDQYSALLNGGIANKGQAERERKADLQRIVADKYGMIDRAKDRAEWIKHEEAQKKKDEDKEKAERIAYAQIDWHDFMVLTEVTWTQGDDEADLPAPTSKNELQAQSLEQKASRAINPNMRIEEAMPGEDLSTPYYPTPPPANPSPAPPVLPPQPAMTPTPPPPMPTMPTMPNKPAWRSAQEEEEEHRIRERAAAQARSQQAQALARGPTGPMRIKNNYVPKAAVKKQANNVTTCQICGQPVDYNELQAHMKICTLDPRSKNQKEIADARASTTNLNTAAVVQNLKRLRSARDDLFDPVTGEEITEEEKQRRKRAETGYSGQTDPRLAAAMAHAQRGQTTNLEEQLKHIHAKANENKQA